MKVRLFANASLVGLLLVPLAHAQMTPGLTGKIPFQFRVGDKTLPAGEYRINRTSSRAEFLVMRNLDAKGTGIVFLSDVVQAKSAQNSKLVFHRYGSAYFLSQVWQGRGVESGVQLRQSKAERVIAHQTASLRKPENVELALLSFHPATK